MSATVKYLLWFTIVTMLAFGVGSILVGNIHYGILDLLCVAIVAVVLVWYGKTSN